MSLPESGWWNLEELVAEANRQLPRFLPDGRRDSRFREEVNPRLVRHYAGLRLLDDPEKEGKEARYTRRHLLQLLVLRRLLAEGYATSAISALTFRPDEALEAILESGPPMLSPAPLISNPAMDYLRGLASPGAAPPPQSWFGPPASRPKQSSAPSRPETWSRVRLREGLEMHVSDRFVAPRTAAEREHLMRTFEQALKDPRPRK